MKRLQGLRITLLTIAALAVFIAGVAGINHLMESVERKHNLALAAEAGFTDPLEDGLHIRLLSDQEPNAEFSPGAEIPVNARIQNTGTDKGYVFIKITMPVVEGAELEDSSSDSSDSSSSTDALLYTPSVGWEEVEDGVYFYKELLAPGETTTPLIDHWTIPNYDLSYRRASEGSEVQIFTGSIPIDTAVEAASSVSLKGYSIMEMDGTPEQLWEMLGKGE